MPISNILGSLDKKIDNNKKIIAKLKKLASDYIDYFYSIGKTKKVVLSDVVTRDKNAIVDGPFGTQMKIEDYRSSGVPIIEMEYLEGSTIFSEIKHYISEEKYTQVKRSSAYSGDLIISKTGTLGLLGVMPSNIDKAVVVSRLAKISPNKEIISSYVLLILLERLSKAKYWEHQSSGSTMPILNIDILKNAPIELAENMNELNQIVDTIYKKIDNLLKENIQLITTKNLILPLLMNGQVSVK